MVQITILLRLITKVSVLHVLEDHACTGQFGPIERMWCVSHGIGIWHHIYRSK